MPLSDPARAGVGAAENFVWEAVAIAVSHDPRLMITALANLE
jgi:hypothetical protein